MEPVRGGKLAALAPADMEKLAAFRPDASAASWALRYLQGLDNVKVILGGMSNLAQLVDNVHTFETAQPTTPEETAVLYEIAEGMKNAVPCTACRYCCGECPQQLDIPKLLLLYSDMRFSPSFNVGMVVDGLPEQKRPSACVGCGSCAAMCPQNIDIPGAMRDFVDLLERSPSWVQICKEREQAAQRAKQG